MREKEFNLLDEPWIRVLLPDCTVREVSLPDALLHAQEYADLAGEMPVQDTAILRLLLAVLHSVFGEQVSEDETDSTDDALDLWRTYGQRSVSRRNPFATILPNGMNGFGCSIRNARSGRCRRRKAARNILRPS